MYLGAALIGKLGSSKLASTVATTILQIAYYPPLLEARSLLLKRDDYDVLSALGNDQAIALVSVKTFDLIVIGFSAPHHVRSTMVRWLKQHAPQTPVVALLAHEGEHFPDADCQTLSEDPRTWLDAIAKCIKEHS